MLTNPKVVLTNLWDKKGGIQHGSRNQTRLVRIMTSANSPLLKTFLDSGVPDGSTDYTTLVIIHGWGFHAGTFEHILALGLVSHSTRHAIAQPTSRSSCLSPILATSAWSYQIGEDIPDLPRSPRRSLRHS